MFVKRQPMNKTIAVIFLLLFSFVHIAKAAHTHSCQTVTKEAKTISDKSNLATACAICEFQVAKELLLPVLLSISPITTYTNSEFIAYLSPLHFIEHKSLLLRGPPVFSSLVEN